MKRREADPCQARLRRRPGRGHPAGNDGRGVGNRRSRGRFITSTCSPMATHTKMTTTIWLALVALALYHPFSVVDVAWGAVHGSSIPRLLQRSRVTWVVPQIDPLSR